MTVYLSAIIALARPASEAGSMADQMTGSGFTARDAWNCRGRCM